MDSLLFQFNLSDGNINHKQILMQFLVIISEGNSSPNKKLLKQRHKKNINLNCINQVHGLILKESAEDNFHYKKKQFLE
jgi:hypothetical protein